MKVIYRPHRGGLNEAMKEKKVFDSFEELQKYVSEQFPEWFKVRPCEIIPSGKPVNDERIGWEDSDYLCIDSYENVSDKQGYEKYFGGKYDCPLCIGMFATKWTDYADVKYPSIQKYMTDHNLSLREFARRCDMPSSTMCRLLKGDTEPSKSTIDKILLETGLSYEECFKEKYL